MTKTVIGPKSPKQQMMLAANADTVVIGGAAGSGKSFIALLFYLKYVDDPYFRGIIFRKTTAEITAQGGLWENGVELYKQIYGNKLKVRIKDLKITAPTGASLKFSHLEQEQDKFRHQGAQYSFILFDEGTHFSQTSVEYLGTRLRSARAKHKQ
ncbi:MAG TPA: terminase family protein, partial [Methanosarcina sp.]|nr:terminase family protein [Methanosarcina sp.]